jgi:hypothetical protein
METTVKLNSEQIQEQAMRLLEAYPQGIRWAALLRAVGATSPETLSNTIASVVRNLLTTRATEIVKVARGTYQLAKFVENDNAAAAAEELAREATPVKAEAPGSEALTEQDFYLSFAKWLEDHDEVTVAETLGGNSLGGKWGTPDVIGVLKPRAQDIFKFEPQIVTAEIKAVPNQPVVAFGQAVAYRLFSHKSYIVVPRLTSSDDLYRLTSLCSLHGVGLVTFVLNKEQPDYTIIVLPAVAAPDMFYVNDMLERLKAREPALLEKLF